MRKKETLNGHENEISKLLETGNWSKAQLSVRELVKRRIAREEVLDVAKLCRRVYLPELGLRLLKPFIYPGPRKTHIASPFEKAEYSANLILIGAVDEANQLLEPLLKENIAEAFLIRSFSHVVRWEYSASIPLLINYLNFPGISEYERIVAHVNLIAALVHEKKHGNAESHINELFPIVEKANRKLLYANLLELSAQNAISQGAWKKARGFLNKAEEVLEKCTSPFHLFIRKWRAVASLLESEGSERSQKDLQAVKVEASLQGDFETVRDCDAYLASTIKDTRLLLHVYFGTPFASYRSHLLKMFHSHCLIPETYEWLMMGQVKEATILDVASARIEPNGVSLEYGEILHRLLAVLSSDFYRPSSLGSIHSFLYPNECFNPFSSRGRIHQVIRRMRRWFEENKLPLDAEEKSGHYQLIAHQSFLIRVPRERKNFTRQVPLLAKLQETWPLQDFSVLEASHLLGLSPMSVRRLLMKARTEGQVTMLGSGNTTRYLFQKKAA